MDSNSAIKHIGEGAALREYLEVLKPFLEADVTEICINRPGEVWTEGSQGWQKHDVPKADMHYCMQVAKLVANYNQQAISSASPMLSAILPGDLRVQILIPPAVENGTVAMTIRLPMTTTRDLSAYVADGAFSRYMWGRPAELDARRAELSRTDQILVDHLQGNRLLEFIKTAILAKKNIAVVGDTGSGKTTLMKSMCQVIPATERLLTIEDVRELFLPQGNRLHMLYSGTGQGTAKITPSELIKGSMRLKPDRVLLAELRGGEAFDFLNLLTTGHSGSITSFHAESCALAIERYVFMCKAHPDAAVYQDVALKRLVAMTIDVIIHVTAETLYDDSGNFAGKERYVTEVHFDPLAKLAARFGGSTVFRAGNDTKA